MLRHLSPREDNRTPVLFFCNICFFFLISFKILADHEGYEGMGKPRNRNGIERFEEVPMYIALLTYLGYGILVLVGYVKEFFANFIPSQIPEVDREVAPTFFSVIKFSRL